MDSLEAMMSITPENNNQPTTPETSSSTSPPTTTTNTTSGSGQDHTLPSINSDDQAADLSIFDQLSASSSSHSTEECYIEDYDEDEINEDDVMGDDAIEEEEEEEEDIGSPADHNLVVMSASNSASGHVVVSLEDAVNRQRPTSSSVRLRSSA